MSDFGESCGVRCDKFVSRIEAGISRQQSSSTRLGRERIVTERNCQRGNANLGVAREHRTGPRRIRVSGLRSQLRCSTCGPLQGNAGRYVFSKPQQSRREVSEPAGEQGHDDMPQKPHRKAVPGEIIAVIAGVSTDKDQSPEFTNRWRATDDQSTNAVSNADKL